VPASGGGTSCDGNVVAVKTNGTGFTTLHSFTQLSVPYSGNNRDGANPYAALIVAGNTLYGTAADGGTSGNGTVFSLSLPSPQLTLLPSEANVVVTWPTNAIGFTLQSTTDLASPASWTNSGVSVILNGQYTVTNPITGTQQFFRLSQ